MKLDSLYKLDAKGQVRQWTVFVESDYYWTESGLKDGQKIKSEPVYCKAKNIGKKTETTAEEQAIIEATNLRKKKIRTEKYLENLEDSDTTIKSPMLAKSYENGKSKLTSKFFVQPKLDGVRCITNKDGLWSRKGVRINSAKHVEWALEKFFKTYPEAELDGELYNHDYHDNFNELAGLIRLKDYDSEKCSVIQYHVYDLRGTTVNYEYRHALLAEELKEFSKYVHLVDTYKISDQALVAEHYADFIQQGYEGAMLRNNTPYEYKRSGNLLKYKSFIDREFEILNILEGNGKFKGIASTIVVNNRSKVVYATLKGTLEFKKSVYADKDCWIGGTVTVQYFEETPDGSLRFPVATKIYKQNRDL